MYPGKQVWDNEEGRYVTVSNVGEAIKRDPKRYSRNEPPSPSPEPAPEPEPADDTNTESDV